MNQNKIKIVVATHKKYEMPKDNMYLPVQVGKEGKDSIGYQGDNEGENISNKNQNYCELTGLYWAWKNLDAEYVGLSHYRRHFCLKKKSKNVFDNILTYDEANEILNSTDIILPKKRKYYIENLYNHYKHTLYIEPLDETRKIIEEKYPDYLNEFDKLHTRTSAHMFNMLIMKKDILKDYCEWLYNILFELEKRIDISKYDAFHARFFGRVSELLLDVWINTNNLKYKEVKVIDMENINWVKKGFSFLKAKFANQKYEKSF
ncbi:MAG: DUF4422 domain-containing protein [Bacilli bacterium]|nr:DUF4422 domain-containing protein [Bacilli bacterium]